MLSWTTCGLVIVTAYLLLVVISYLQVMNFLWACYSDCLFASCSDLLSACNDEPLESSTDRFSDVWLSAVDLLRQKHGCTGLCTLVLIHVPVETRSCPPPSSPSSMRPTCRSDSARDWHLATNQSNTLKPGTRNNCVQTAITARQTQSCFVTLSPVVKCHSEGLQNHCTGRHHIHEVWYRNHCSGKCVDVYWRGYGMALSNGCKHGLSICLSAFLSVWC